jgi:hypothetical protein
MFYPNAHMPRINKGRSISEHAIGIAVWQEYPTRNPGGRKVPPEDLNDRTDPDMAAYVTHATATIAMRVETERGPIAGAKWGIHYVRCARVR